MNGLAVILLALALVCFVLAAFGTAYRVNLVATGLASITLLWFLQAIGVHA